MKEEIIERKCPTCSRALSLKSVQITPWWSSYEEHCYVCGFVDAGFNRKKIKKEEKKVCKRCIVGNSGKCITCES